MDDPSFISLSRREEEVFSSFIQPNYLSLVFFLEEKKASAWRRFFLCFHPSNYYITTPSVKSSY